MVINRFVLLFKYYLVYKQYNYTYCDGTVGNVEYSIEEGEVFASHEWKPFGEYSVNNRELEHIYYFALEKWCISTTFWHKLSYLIIAFVKYKTIETTVDNIA